MTLKSIQSYGNWPSPITASMVATASNQLSEITVYADSVYWLERLSSEKGRTTIMRHHNGQTTALMPAPYNCRSRVHEYGGGSYSVSCDGLFFVNDSDQQIYLLKDHVDITKITTTGSRFADIQYAGSFLIAVLEDHSTGSELPDNRLVSINVSNGDIHTLCAQHDFYASPRVDIDDEGNMQLAWLCWNHPDMPWDATLLMVANLSDTGSIASISKVAGGGAVSIFQPSWSPDHTLYYVSDQSGWWNLYRSECGTDTQQALLPMQAEFGQPQWVFAQSTYCFSDNNTLIASCNRDGYQRLLQLELSSLQYEWLNSEHNNFDSLSGNAGSFACLQTSARQSAAIYFHSNGAATKLSADNGQEALQAAWISQAEPYTLSSRFGDNIYANYYPPCNADIEIDNNTKPPLIVLSHGGPTGQSSACFDIKKQFWTSRGFAILDVNYSGSTGYGKTYQQRLHGNWGIRDVTDVCDAALAMVKLGLADENKLIIKGSSAGGYTVLAALTFETVFKAGASYYGISDLQALAQDTHKFEARYLDKLVGNYPQHKQRYLDRSPINHVDRLNCPVIFFQGDEDKVVPKSQAEKMVTALDKKNIPVAYLLFKGEQHGFRQAQTIIDTLNAELCFYKKIFKLGGDEDCDLIIRNLRRF